MGLLDNITAWFKRETAEVKEAVDDATRDLDASLSRRQRQLDASPSERMDMLKDEIENNEDSLDAIRERIEATAARAEAVEELATDPPAES